MKIGDLIKHRLDGRWDEVGIVIEITKTIGIYPGGMASILWNIENTFRNDRLYRTRDLEVINESR